MAPGFYFAKNRQFAPTAAKSGEAARPTSLSVEAGRQSGRPYQQTEFPMQIFPRRSFHLFVMSALLGTALAALPASVDRGNLFGTAQAFATGRPGGDAGNGGSGHGPGTSGQDGGHDGNSCERFCN
jgi:hypothetical protein